MDERALGIARELSDLVQEKYTRILEKRTSYSEFKEFDSVRRKIEGYEDYAGMLKDNGILYLPLGEKGKPIRDEVLGVIKKKGIATNDKGKGSEWYVISIDNPELKGSDLIVNHFLRNKDPGEDYLMQKYASYGNKIVFFEEAINNYFAEAYDNWQAYEEARRKGFIISNKDRVRKLKYMALSELKEKSTSREDFIDKASESYITSFLRKQEAKKLDSGLSDFVEEIYFSLKHLLEADFDMKYLVMADIYEKAIRSKGYNQDVHNSIMTFLVSVGGHTLSEQRDIDDIMIAEEEASKMIKWIEETKNDQSGKKQR